MICSIVIHLIPGRGLYKKTSFLPPSALVVSPSRTPSRNLLFRYPFSFSYLDDLQEPSDSAIASIWRRRHSSVQSQRSPDLYCSSWHYVRTAHQLAFAIELKVSIYIRYTPQPVSDPVTRLHVFPSMQNYLDNLFGWSASQMSSAVAPSAPFSFPSFSFLPLALFLASFAGNIIETSESTADVYNKFFLRAASFAILDVQAELYQALPFPSFHAISVLFPSHRLVVTFVSIGYDLVHFFC